MKTDLFQSCGHWWVFQICWHIECSTFTAYIHWNQAPPKGQQVLEQDIQCKFSSNTGSPELQYTGCPKSLQSHWHLITHCWTLHCTPERRNPAPPTRTPTQASLTRKPFRATCPTPPTVRKLHNKENSTNCQNTERPPQTQQYNKMKRQRNTQQVKEQDKCPPNETKENKEGIYLIKNSK